LYRNAVPAVVERLDLDTGERRPWRVLQPEDRAGVGLVADPIIRPDVDAYAYRRVLAKHSADAVDEDSAGHGRKVISVMT
jgi:hypothetical protein